MGKQIIMPTMPNMGLISVLSKPYEVLTDEFIQRWLYQLYNDHLIDPEYLFVNRKGQTALQSIINSMSNWCRFGMPEIVAEEMEREHQRSTVYINQTTGTVMHIVVLPTLQDGLLLVGNLVLHQGEERV